MAMGSQRGRSKADPHTDDHEDDAPATPKPDDEAPASEEFDLDFSALSDSSGGGGEEGHAFLPEYGKDETPGLDTSAGQPAARDDDDEGGDRGKDAKGGGKGGGGLVPTKPKSNALEVEAASKVDERSIEVYRQLLNGKDAGSAISELKAREGYSEEEVDELLKLLGRRYGMDVVRARAYKMSPELVATVDRNIARKYRCVPLEKIGDHLTLAITDPWDLQIQDDLRNIFPDNELHIVLADEREVNAILSKYYTGEQQNLTDVYEKAVHDLKEDSGPSKSAESDLDAYMRTLDDIDPDADDTPIVKLVSRLMQEALHSRASDLHFECYQHTFKVRFRIDGVLHDRVSPEKRLQNAIITRLKIMAGMDVAEKRVPQDGRIQVRIDGKPIDFRVSSLPSIHGESVVLRLLDKTGLMLGLDQVGFLPDSVEKFSEMIRRPNGIVLITGPTGSGKTTTLYSALNTINSVDTKILTIENPVEYQLDGIVQTQVNEDVGLTFSIGLRTMLRQSPDVILIGEIRDRETGEIAVRAALTGHLVFATLHTNDAPSAATRLIEMGVKPFLVSSALEAAVAQRLVRMICKECKEAYRPSMEEMLAMGLDPEKNPNLRVYRGRGCAGCGFTGYRGRTAIFEIMHVSEELKELILEHASSEQMREVGREQGMRTLREDGWQKVLRGDTTVVEVARITQSDAD